MTGAVTNLAQSGMVEQLFSGLGDHPVLGYLTGTISTGYIVGKIYKLDIRDYGSGLNYNRKKWNQLLGAFNDLMNLPQETRSNILFRGQIILKNKEARKGFAYEELRVTWTRNSFAKPVIAPAN